MSWQTQELLDSYSSSLTGLQGSLGAAEGNLLSLSSTLESYVSTLNTYSQVLNAPTTTLEYYYYKNNLSVVTGSGTYNYRDTYKAYTPLYDKYTAAYSQYKTEYDKYSGLITEYDTVYDAYGNAVDEHKKSEIALRQVSIRSMDFDNGKDKNQWQAGGNLRNSTYSGGYSWSPTSVPSFDNKRHTGDKNAALLGGNILSYLGYGFGDIMALVNGGELDLNFKDSAKEVFVFSITLQLINPEGIEVAKKEFDYDFESDSSLGIGSGGGGYSGIGGKVDVTEMNNMDTLAEMMQNRVDVTSLNPVSVVISVINAVTGDKTTVEGVLGGMLIGTVQSGIQQAMTKAVASAVGVTSLNVVTALTLGVVSMVLNELFEMAIGVDRSFGFGGEYDRLGSQVLGTQAYTASDGILGISTAIDTLSYSLRFTDTLSLGIVNKIGSDIGSYGEVRNGDSVYKEYYDLATSGNINTGGKQVDNIQKAVAKSLEKETIFAPLHNLITKDYSVIADAIGSGGNGVADNAGGYDNATGTTGVAGGKGNTNGAGPGSSAGPGWSCFTAGTKVLVYVNDVISEVNIEDIRIGDILVGETSNNTVLEYDCPLTDGRPIYGFNGDKEFVTSEHMFFTTGGWKAISAMDALTYHPDTFVELGMDWRSSLSIGDKLVCINGDIVTIDSISKIDVPDDTQVYNFKLDGDNTYYANKYLVHNK